MMNVAVLSLYLLATLFTPQVYPGQDVTVKVVVPSYLELDNNCTFFAMTGNQTLYAKKPGNYTVVVPLTCEAGKVTLTAKRATYSEEFNFEILEPTVSYLVNYSLELKAERDKLAKEVNTLTQKIKELSGKVEEYKKEVQSLNNQIDELKAEREKLKTQISELNAKIDKLNSVIDEKTKIVNSLKKQLRDLRGENYKLKIVSLFIVSLFFGSYAAVIMRRRGY